MPLQSAPSVDIFEMPLSPAAAASLQPVAAFTRPSPSPSPPHLGRKTSLIDLKDWVVDDGPSNIDATRTPTQPAFSKRKVNGGGPLISFESPPRPKPKPKPANLSLAPKPPQLPPRKASSTSLRSSASPQPAFLYPPRRTDSLTVDNLGGLDPHSRNSPGHAPSSSISSFHSVSLSSDTDISTPGSVANFIATFPVDHEHSTNGTDADSVSLSESYEEISTSSIASPATERLMNIGWEKEMAKRKGIMPPKLPERPNSASKSPGPPLPPPSHPVSRNASASGSTPSSPIIRPVISANSSSSTLATPPPYAPRRSAPPPPPSRSSDRSSIQSTTTSQRDSLSSRRSSLSHGSIRGVNNAINLKTKRPTPVPLAARKRYEVVFTRNVIQRRMAQKQKENEKPALLGPNEARGRRAVGWRGLSVDLITGGGDVVPPTPQQGDQTVDEVVSSDDKLEGGIVRHIWKKSGLDAARLAEIWNECDLTGQGALNLESFVKGMWRIDEELRRTQVQALKSAGSLGAYRSQSIRTAPVPKLPQRPTRDLLR